VPFSDSREKRRGRVEPDNPDKDGAQVQISNQQVDLIRSTLRKTKTAANAPVESVEDLAASHGVKMDEVRRFTERAIMAEEDPLRERRIRELRQRIAAGSYGIQSEDLLDMAERRAVADRAAEL
jgi:anti-sigma28 factor (negative regulator of flagellin synthesis)